MNATRPRATLSVDLDDLWSFERSFGRTGWQARPSYLAEAMPRLLQLLDGLNLKTTAFVIGSDAAEPAHAAQFAALAGAGHEIASHSYNHDMAFHRQSKNEILRELVLCDDAIADATGQRPRGFRGPAFGLSTALIEALSERGYIYDSSIFPNLLGFAARLYHQAGRRRAGDDVEELPTGIYGGLADTMRPLKPFQWRIGGRRLTEVPVTTMPLLRLPFHGTYLHFLADRSPALARSYFRVALSLCALRGVSPCFVLHLTDLIGKDDAFAPAGMPGMQRTASEKQMLMKQVLDMLSSRFEVVTIGDFVSALAGEAEPLPSHEAGFAV